MTPHAPASKLALDGPRRRVAADRAAALLTAIFRRLGCPGEAAAEVAHHLTDASLSGVESHGVMRVLQYAGQMRAGALDPAATPCLRQTPTGTTEIDGGGGIGIPAMWLAYREGLARAWEHGLSAVAIRHVGHTGRHGAFADWAATQGAVTICMGGGNRRTWRQVAPHGGAKALLPTNPWCIGVPGGANGPVVVDFATSTIAGGWIYAARSAGALLPEGCVIDANGRPTRDPEAFFQGGAILPSGGHKGYALALVGELIGEALLGPATTECQWLLITLDASRHRAAPAMAAAAEDILAELRACPPAPGIARVEIPGERERAHRDASRGTIQVPERTWTEIEALARDLGAA